MFTTSMFVPSRAHLWVPAIGVVVSGLVAVYAVEAFLFWDPLELRGPHPRAGFDGRDYFEVVSDLRASGVAAYPVVGASAWAESPPRVHDSPLVPLSGIPRTTVVLCNEAGTYVTYESDRFGFNAPDAQWDLSAEVALVGDSFVEGWCVPREDTMGAFIRREIPATLNVGYSGHGPLAELGTIREYVASRQPADVFWFFYEGNDLQRDLPGEMESPILRRYLEPGFSQQLQRRAEPLGDEMRRSFDARLASWKPSPPQHPVVSIAKLRSLRALARRGVEQTGLRSQPPHSSPLGDFRRILSEAKRSVEEWGGSLHFVYLPHLPSVLNRSTDHEDRARVLSLVADLEIEIIDLLPDFRQHSSPLSLFPYQEGRHLVTTRGLHYNADGHHFVARRVLNQISRHRQDGKARHLSADETRSDPPRQPPATHSH